MSKNNFSTSLIAISVCLMFVHQLKGDGNVTVEVRNGELRVTGQNNTQQDILVTQGFAEGVYFFSDPQIGMNLRTRFNGGDFLVVTGVTSSTRFDLKSGPKTLILSNDSFPNGPSGEGVDPLIRFPGNLRISNSGSQSVIVIMNNVQVGGNTEIATKNGKDAFIMVDSFFLGNLKINSGGGDDVVLLTKRSGNSVITNNLECNLGSGNDQCLLAGVDILGSVSSSLGAGNDCFGFLDTEVAVSVSINGNGGADCTTALPPSPTQTTRSIEAFGVSFNAIFVQASVNPVYAWAEEILISLVGDPT